MRPNSVFRDHNVHKEAVERPATTPLAPKPQTKPPQPVKEKVYERYKREGNTADSKQKQSLTRLVCLRTVRFSGPDFYFFLLGKQLAAAAAFFRSCVCCPAGAKLWRWIPPLVTRFDRRNNVDDDVITSPSVMKLWFFNLKIFLLERSITEEEYKRGLTLSKSAPAPPQFFHWLRP